MSLINCPECRKSVSETACACPGCGFPLTPGVAAFQKVKKQKTDQAAALIGVGVFLLIIALCSGVLRSSSPSSSSSSPSSSSPPAPKPVIRSDYATDAARQRELGAKYHPTPSEIREYLILDGRQAVREGSMSKAAFERYTGEKFPDD
jgi:hypothetical protein